MELNYKYVELNPLEFYHYRKFLNESIKSYADNAVRRNARINEISPEIFLKEYYDEKKQKYYCKECQYECDNNIDMYKHLALSVKHKSNPILVSNAKCESYCVRKENKKEENYQRYLFCCGPDLRSHIKSCERCKIVEKWDLFKKESLKDTYEFQEKMFKSNDNKINTGRFMKDKNVFILEDELLEYIDKVDNKDLNDLLIQFKYHKDIIINTIKNPEKIKSKNFDDFKSYLDYLKTIKDTSEKILNSEKSILNYLKSNNEPKYKDIYKLVEYTVSARRRELTNDKNKFKLYNNLWTSLNNNELDQKKINDIIANYSKDSYENKKDFQNYLFGKTNELNSENISYNKSMQEMAISYSLFFNLNDLRTNSEGDTINIGEKPFLNNIKVQLNKKIEINENDKTHTYEPDIYFEIDGIKYIIEIDGECHKKHFRNKNVEYNKFVRKDNDVVRECLLTAKGYYLIHLDDISKYIGTFNSKTFNKEKVLQAIEKNTDNLNTIRRLIELLIKRIQGNHQYQSYLIYYDENKDKFTYGGFKAYKDKDNKYNLIVRTPFKKVTQSV